MSPAGLRITQLQYTSRFERDLKRLDPQLADKVRDALRDLLADPYLPHLRFEKLQGHRKPSVFTIHATTNHSHKVSFEIDGDRAILRRIDTHKEIDRAP